MAYCCVGVRNYAKADGERGSRCSSIATRCGNVVHNLGLEGSEHLTIYSAAPVHFRSALDMWTYIR